MPLIAAEMKQKFQATIQSGLQREFAAAGAVDPAAMAQWTHLANAISDIAMDIVMELQTNAMVAPGIPVVTAGSPVAQAGTTVAPGKIL